MRRTLTTPKVDAGPGWRYAYGFEDRPWKGQRIIGHGGGAPGISAGLDMYLDLGISVAILTNTDRGAEGPRRQVGELLWASR
jgi:hypothetical protein